eukprot:m.218201 g.218201  ORF g.218201 m.218201 type:complete len:101 (+) comp17216_c1_seq2:950-1252(+)
MMLIVASKWGFPRTGWGSLPACMQCQCQQASKCDKQADSVGSSLQLLYLWNQDGLVRARDDSKTSSVSLWHGRKGSASGMHHTSTTASEKMEVGSSNPLS